MPKLQMTMQTSLIKEGFPAEAAKDVSLPIKVDDSVNLQFFMLFKHLWAILAQKAFQRVNLSNVAFEI